MKLHLGVADIAYTHDKSTTTTGEVAQHLEDKYHVMRVFLEENEEFIGDKMAQSISNAIQLIGKGRPAPKNPLIGSQDAIQARFRQFLDSGEMEKIMPATQPIAAAQAGVNHRKKHPYAKENKSRRAFIDTGLYRSSFRAWFS
jgi:hypothetical protein